MRLIPALWRVRFPEDSWPDEWSQRMRRPAPPNEADGNAKKRLFQEALRFLNKRNSNETCVYDSTSFAECQAVGPRSPSAALCCLMHAAEEGRRSESAGLLRSVAFLRKVRLSLIARPDHIEEVRAAGPRSPSAALCCPMHTAEEGRRSESAGLLPAPVRFSACLPLCGA